MDNDTEDYYACLYEADHQATGFSDLIARSGFQFLGGTRPRCVKGAWEAVLYRVIAECEDGSYILETNPDGEPRPYRGEWLDTYHRGFDPDHIYAKVDWVEV